MRSAKPARKGYLCHKMRNISSSSIHLHEGLFSLLEGIRLESLLRHHASPFGLRVARPTQTEGRSVSGEAERSESEDGLLSRNFADFPIQFSNSARDMSSHSRGMICPSDASSVSPRK